MLALGGSLVLEDGAFFRPCPRATPPVPLVSPAIPHGFESYTLASTRVLALRRDLAGVAAILLHGSDEYIAHPRPELRPTRAEGRPRRRCPSTSEQFGSGRCRRSTGRAPASANPRTTEQRGPAVSWLSLSDSSSATAGAAAAVPVLAASPRVASTGRVELGGGAVGVPFRVIRALQDAPLAPAVCAFCQESGSRGERPIRLASVLISRRLDLCR
jgi:hypothetical protein